MSTTVAAGVAGPFGPRAAPAPNNRCMTQPADGRNDASLVAAVARAEEGALREIYDRHGAALFGLARRILQQPEAAEEIVQEVLLRLWNEPDRFDPGRGALRSFLFRETHSRAIENLRAEGARRAREERYSRESPPPVGDLDQEAWSVIRAELVRDAISDLSASEHEAIDLAYFGGFTYREVAMLLGEAEGTIKSRIRAGLGKLATTFEQRGLGAPR
jgi:RNA polymerase sigma-70 factor (ECF subfamily)